MHRTNEQDVVDAKRKLAELKSAYATALTCNIENREHSSEKDSLSEILACQKAGSEYFNYAEEFVGNSDLLGAHDSSLWVQGFAEDCADILKTMPDHFSLLQEGFTKAGHPASFELPSGAAYANMQRMVKAYLEPKETNHLMAQFKGAGLPIYGFLHEAKEHMSKTLQIVLSFGFGVIFIIVMLAIAIFLPYPSTFQLFAFRITLALAAGGIAAMLPGFLVVQVSNYLRAGGALAAFVVIYFFNPATLGIQGRATEITGLFVKQLSEEKGLVEYFWKQADLKFRFPATDWNISSKAAEAGLGDLTLQYANEKDAQIQMHVSVLDDKYREKWDEFKKNTINLWKGTIEQFGPFNSQDIYIDGRRSFVIHGTLRGEKQGTKLVDLVYTPLGDNRLFEIHLTRNTTNKAEIKLDAAYDLVKSTIHFERN